MTQLDPGQHGIHTLEDIGNAEGAQILIAGEDGQGDDVKHIIDHIETWINGCTIHTLIEHIILKNSKNSSSSFETVYFSLV